ncbi:MAG: aminotransferase [Mangrovicoccus sp.]|nr:aminotransferase [Mangrovicoccus sp.]
MSNPIGAPEAGLAIAAAMAATNAPPVMEARRWLETHRPPDDLPLINVSQAAPTAPPPEGLRAAMAEAVLHRPDAHLYGPVLGLPDLRDAISARWAKIYGSAPGARRLAITAGCNQAFCAAIATLATPGDEVILPVPWYFNHAMWLHMQGVTPRPLATGPDLLPDPEAAEALITPRSRAIVLVTPNNPGGTAYPPGLIRAFYELCQRRGIALILDETYRDYLGSDAPPHDLFDDPDWDRTLVQLYSFSKAYRLTGHRTGALLAAEPVLRQVEKFLDTVAICAPQIGQIGALWGLENLGDWLESERQEILARGAAMRAAMAGLPGWELRGCGAYFAYMRHPFDLPSNELAPLLVQRTGILALPGSMFRPASDGSGARELRLAFANIDREGIAKLADRLRALPLQLAPGRGCD